MEAPERGALTLVRLIGVMLLVFSLLEVGLDVAKSYAPLHPVPLNLVAVGFWLLPAGVGLALLIKARAVADWISNILDL